MALSEKDWRDLYEAAVKRINSLKEEVKNDNKTSLHNLKYFRDCGYLVSNIELPSFSEIKEVVSFIDLYCKKDKSKIDFDPLSEMLSTDMAEYPYGFGRFFGYTAPFGRRL